MRVLVADDERLSRAGLAKLVEERGKGRSNVAGYVPRNRPAEVLTRVLDGLCAGSSVGGRSAGDQREEPCR